MDKVTAERRRFSWDSGVTDDEDVASPSVAIAFLSLAAILRLCVARPWATASGNCAPLTCTASGHAAAFADTLDFLLVALVAIGAVLLVASTQALRIVAIVVTACIAADVVVGFIHAYRSAPSVAAAVGISPTVSTTPTVWGVCALATSLLAVVIATAAHVKR